MAKPTKLLEPATNQTFSIPDLQRTLNEGLSSVDGSLAERKQIDRLTTILEQTT